MTSPAGGFPGCCRITRPRFLLGAGAGLAVGAPLAWLALQSRLGRGGFSGRTAEVRRPELAMPGRFPGRVVEVNHPGAVSDAHVIARPAVRAMVDRGLCELTGAEYPREAWRSFFEAGDVVGIKVNPVGRRPLPGEAGRVAGAVG